MNNEQWWASVAPSTREWLIANNGDAVPQDIAEEVARAGGPVAAEDTSEESEQPGLFYPDEITDWIEERANDEDPAAST